MHSLLRRPSTWIVLCAGLLAADRLRSPSGGWTDATFIVGALLLIAFTVALRRPRTPHRREVEITVLPLAGAIEPDGRRRILWFVLFLVALIVVPVGFAMATA